MPESTVIEIPETLEYKGHPLRRKGNYIYYGRMSDKYIVVLQVLETKKLKDIDIASRVSVQLQLTDLTVRPKERIIKKSEKESLYVAMDVAAVWLERALASK